MPIPNKIELLNYHLSETANKLLTVMLNKPDMDYAALEKFVNIAELSNCTPDEIYKSVQELYNRNFLLRVQKPYGIVYAVNKLRIADMEFVYSLQEG